MTTPESILVIKPSSFGDVVHTLPAVARLKTAWPKAHLAWVINSEWAPLLAGNKFVDETVVFPRGEFRGWRGAVKFLRWCRRNVGERRPDLAIDFQGLLRSAWIGRASKGERLVGMADSREGARWFYDVVVDMLPGTPHAAERYLAVADAVLRRHGVKPDELPSASSSTLLGAGEAVPDGEAVLPDHYILVHPFARGRGKSLSTESLQRLCERLAPSRVVVVGRRGGSTPRPLPGNCLDLLDQTSLGELIRLVRKAAVVVTVDSGPSHLAAALERPMIAIHTWSDPRRVGPWRKEAWVWKNGRLLQMKDLPALDETFFGGEARGLEEADVAAIAALATSLSGFSA